MSPLARGCCLDAVAALDNISLEADRSWSTVQLEKETAGIAEDAAELVASPERSGAGSTILTDWLLGVVGKTGHY